MSATKYVLTADHFFRVEGEEGRQIHYRRGDEIDGLSAADVKRLSDAGAIAKRGSDDAKEVAAVVVEPEPIPVDDTAVLSAQVAAAVPAEPERPRKAAAIDKWREFVVATTDITAEQAAKMDKDELRSAVPADDTED